MLEHVTSLGQVARGKWYLDYGADKIYIADDPTRKESRSQRHPVRLQEQRLERHHQRPDRREVRHAAVRRAPSTGSVAPGWIVKDNEVRWNQGKGIKTGSRMQVLRNKVHHQGQLGIAGGGNNVLVQDNEISYNNTAGFTTGWEAGGIQVRVHRRPHRAQQLLAPQSRRRHPLRHRQHQRPRRGQPGRGQRLARDLLRDQLQGDDPQQRGAAQRLQAPEAGRDHRRCRHPGQQQPRRRDLRQHPREQSDRHRRLRVRPWIGQVRPVRPGQLERTRQHHRPDQRRAGRRGHPERRQQCCVHEPEQPLRSQYLRHRNGHDQVLTNG